MFDEIRIKYFHPVLKLGFQDIRNVWLIDNDPVKLSCSLHRGNLVFRMPVSGKRISYATLKKGLIKKQFIIRKHYSLLPF